MEICMFLIVILKNVSLVMEICMFFKVYFPT
jgi:hypothetical protein